LLPVTGLFAPFGKWLHCRCGLSIALFDGRPTEAPAEAVRGSRIVRFVKGRNFLGLPCSLSGCTLNSTQSKAEERKVIEELYAGLGVPRAHLLLLTHLQQGSTKFCLYRRSLPAVKSLLVWHAVLNFLYGRSTC
jgi:hypothetical protein